MSAIYLDKKMLQICIIGKNCYELNENWAKVLGKTMVGLSRHDTPETTGETEYLGKSYTGLGLETNTFDLAGNGKSIQFEIMAALNGPSEWCRFMVERDRGIHHIAFGFTETDFTKGLQDLKANTGMAHIQRGIPYGSTDCDYAYLATKEPVGSTIEILGFGEHEDHVARYREAAAVMSSMDDHSAPLAGQVPSDVTMIVRDIDRAVSQFAALFHEDAPTVQSERCRVKRGGQEREIVIRTAKMDRETSTVRFLEPVSGQSGWSDFSDAWGTGFYSMAFDVADLAQKQEQLVSFGWTPIETGLYADGTVYALLDGGTAYGCVVELRSSNEIRKRLTAQNAEKADAGAEGLKFNAGTPIRDVVESEARCAILDKAIPGIVARIKENMAIAYRMPLGMAFRLVENSLSEAEIQTVYRQLNEAKDEA